MKTNRSVLVLAIAVFSCTAFAQFEQDVASGLEKKRQEFVACRADVAKNWQSSALESKLPFDGYKTPTLEQLGNHSKPTSKEKTSIANFVNGIDGCDAIGAEWLQKNSPPDLNSLMSYYWSETKYIIADLYAGKITYGDAAKRRAILASDWNAKRNAMVDSFRAQAAADEQRKQAAESQRKREADERRFSFDQQLRDQQLREQQRAQFNLMQQQAEETRRQNEINSALNLLQMAQPRPAAPIIRGTSCVTKFRNGNAYTDCD